MPTIKKTTSYEMTEPLAAEALKRLEAHICAKRDMSVAEGVPLEIHKFPFPNGYEIRIDVLNGKDDPEYHGRVLLPSLWRNGVFIKSANRMKYVDGNRLYFDYKNIEWTIRF